MENEVATDTGAGAPGLRQKVGGFLTGRPVNRPHVAHVEALGEAEDIRWKGYVKRPATGRLGIACSGGGLRSAAYNLGALQQLRKAGLLAAPEQGGASYMSAVSGGSYMAVAHTVTAGTSDPALFTDELPPWAPSSPEERHLRRNSTYLAAGSRGTTWSVSNILYGLAWNLVPIGIALWLAATLVGWFYAAGLQPGTAATEAGVTVDASRLAFVVVPVGLGVVALAARRLLDFFRVPSGRAMAILKAWSPRLILVGFWIGILVLVLPALLASAAFGADRVAGYLPGWLNGLGVLTAAEVVGVLAVLGAVYRATRGFGQRLLPLVTRLIGPLLIAAPFLYWARGAAVAGFHGWASLSPALLLGAGVLLVMAFVGHNVRWSMHPFYKEQLSSAFVLRREQTAAGLDAAEVPYEQPVLFSELPRPPADSPAHMPELIVCAALNVSDPVVPAGRLAETFTFSPGESGSPLTRYAPTSFYEDGAGASVITLPAMMAISGAAVSPSMGSMTRPSVRLLLALCNIRLGVWVPNPLRRQRHERRRAQQGPWGWLVRGWKEPGLLYVFYEALGWNNLDRDFLYVSDGGHWENLGLVELLRRGCTEIFCFDASGDQLDTFNTIALAIRLARSELQVAIDFNPGELQPDPTTGTSPRDHVVARFRYPDGTPGTLIFAKAAMAADAPWDLHAYHNQDPRFPCHPTIDQLFDDAQFEAYRTVGAHAGGGAAATLLTEREHAAAAVMAAKSEDASHDGPRNTEASPLS